MSGDHGNEGTASGALRSNTVAGVLAFCAYLQDKGYASTSQVNPWRIAVRKVFEAVEGEGYESLDLAGIDLDEYVGRFQTLAGAQYKAESVTTYKRRIQNAVDAHRHYLDTGRPPSFRQGAKRPKAETSDSVVEFKKDPPAQHNPEKRPSGGDTGLHRFTYPLDRGKIAILDLPPRMTPDEVTRLCAFIRTLQDESPEPRQLPRKTGDEESRAA